MSDLRQRVPGHSLVDELLRQWDLGAIHVDSASGLVTIDDEAEGWYLGVLGEREVASRLSEFDDTWTVLHSVPVGSGMTDIDHVLIGPPGVFTINTKFSPGKDVWVAGRGMYVGGFKQSYVHNSLREATQASERLSRACGLAVPVTALIVFVDPAKITHKAAAGGGEYEPSVRVLRHTELANVALERRAFSAEQLARILESAVAPETWHDKPKISTAGPHIVREFLALEEALGPRFAAASTPRPALRADPRSYSNRSTSGKARQPQRRRTSRSRRNDPSVGQMLIGLSALIGLWFWLSGR